MTAVLGVIMTPGLLMLHSQPVTAAMKSTTQVLAPPDTPDQLTGSARGLVSLVDSAATTTSVEVKDTGKDAARPKQALPVEERFTEERPASQEMPKTPDEGASAAPGQPAAGKDSSKTKLSVTTAAFERRIQRQEATDARASAALASLTEWCDDYPWWDSTRSYRYGDKVYFNGQIWEALAISTQAGHMPNSWSGQWLDRGACRSHQSPSVSLSQPAEQALVETRTPTLRAYGHSNDSYSIAVRYQFTVCDSEAMTGSGCTTSETMTPGTWRDAAWKVPAGKLVWSKQYWWKVTATDTSNSMSTTSSKRSFTTGVRQPVIGSQLSARGVDGQEFHQMAGNYTTAATDLSVPVAGPPLSVTRSYNSLDVRTDGIFGAGWSTRWDMKLVREVRGDLVTALVTYPDGRQVRFAANGDGSFQPPPGMYATLAQTEGGWRLMDKSATSYLFDAQGRVVKITDARGRAQELTYNAEGKLDKAVGVGDRSLTFTWTGAHVSAVSSDPVDGKAIVWTYHYEGDRLTAVCAPIAAPNCTRYAYGSGSLYRSSVLDAEPYGYWRLGEAHSSAAVDLGAGAGNASYVNKTGGSIAYGKPGALAGTPDTAIELTSAAVRLPNHALANVGDHASVQLWFKTAGAGVLMAASATDASLLNGPMLYVGTDGKLYGSFAPTGTPMASAGAVNDNQWHQVTLTVAGDQQALYLDGQQIGTLTQAVSTWRPYAEVGAGSITQGSAPGLPAGSGSQDFAFRGQVDEIAVYGKSLTATEVAVHHAARTEAAHKMATITLPSGRVWMSTAYDAGSERVVSHTDAQGGTWKIGAPQYDRATGTSTVTVTDPKNGTLSYVYDAWRGYRLVNRVDQLGKVTAFDYDTGGFPAKRTDPNGNSIEVANDARGNTIAVKTCRVVGNCQTKHRSFYRNSTDDFDPRNDRMVTARDARSVNATDNTYATQWEYTDHGEVAKITTPATPDFPAGRSATYTYTDGTEAAIGGGITPGGLRASVKDSNGNETSYRYTVAGGLAEETTPSGLKVKYEYDALGRLMVRTEVTTAYPDGVSTRFTYNALGQVLTTTAPGVKNEITGVTHTAQTRYAYDSDGNTLSESIIDLTGGDVERTITYTYDVAGRVESATGPEGSVIRTTWDVTGSRASTTDAMGTVVTYTYTKRGELASTTLKNWTGSPVAQHAPQDVILESFAYDPGGRLATQADAMGRKTSYTYFADNRVSQVIADDVRLNGSTTATDVVLQANTYDAAGNVTRRVTGGGQVVVENAYDAASWMTSTTFDPATLKRKTSYAYDAVGNITKKTFTGAGNDRVEAVEYAYNPLGQVIRQTVENGEADLVSSWTYDERGLLVEEIDPRGNTSDASQADFATTLRYDVLGRLVEMISPQVTIEKHGTAITGQPSVKHGYNSVGLETHIVDAEGRIVTSAFDRAGQLISTTGASYSAPDLDAGSGSNPAGGEVGSWKMEEGTGTELADGSGHGRGATLTGSIAWSEGKIGRGVTFDAGTHALTAAAVLRTDQSYTVSAWAKLSRGDVSSAVVSQDGAVNSAFKLAYSSGDKKWRLAAYAADATGSGESKAVSSQEAKIGVWTHLTGIYDAQARKLRLYEDGELVAESDYTSNWNATGGLLIGRTKFDGAYQHSFRGTLDEVRAYDKVLSADQVRTLTATTTPKVSYNYDAAGRIIKVTDPRGYVTSTEYDALGRPVRMTEPGASGPGSIYTVEYDLLGEQLAAVGPTGARAEATYDDLGRTITQTVIERTPTTAAFTTTFSYDTAGNLTKAVAPGNKTASYTVNAAGQITATIDANSNVATATYDALGRTVKATDALGNAAEATYDLAGRQISAKNLDASGTVLRTVGLGYDAAGHQISHTSGEGHVTRQEYDALGRMTKLIEPISADKSITTTFGYDASGARTRLTDGRGNTTWTTYNSLGLVESVSEPPTAAHPNAAERTWTQVYDVVGNNITTLQPGGVRIDRQFDHLNRVVKQTGTGAAINTSARTFAYDATGRLSSIGDYSLVYNDRGLLTQLTKANSQVAAYSYDALGNLTQRIDPTGTADFTWDAGNRLKSADDPVTGRNWTYNYDTANRLTSLTSANPANTQTFAYDALDRLTTQTLTGSSGDELAKIVYEWDKDDRLTAKTTSGTAGRGSNIYSYDRSDRLTSWTDPDGKTVGYVWDEAGNRIKAGEQSFVYDERNRLLSGGGTDYTYTPRGTVATETKAGVTKDLIFDAFDRLITDGESSYGYDALSRLTSRTKGTTQQRFAYSGLSNDLSVIVDGGGVVQAKYGRDPLGGLLGLAEGGNPALGVLSDLHGDVVGTFSGAALTDSIAYDPFGQVTHTSGSKRLLGYQGEYTDPDTGKVNMHARWYQPSTGSFASRDNWTLTPNPSVQANRYTYGNANPLSNTDPSGHSAVETYTGDPQSREAGWQSFDLNGYLVDYYEMTRRLSRWSRPINSVGPNYAWEHHYYDGHFKDPVTQEERDWYNENFGDWTRFPLFGEDEAKRIGVMENGREVDQANYWDSNTSEEVRMAYIKRWSPEMSERELAYTWTAVGGLNSLDPKKVVVAAGGAAYYKVSYSKTLVKFKNYSYFKHVLKYWRTIKRAASNHGINKNILAAVIMWESNDEHIKKYGIAGEAFASVYSDSKKKKNGGWGASVGISQLELYKARMMLQKHYGSKTNKWDPGKARLGDVLEKMLDPNMAIHLAAAWMAHLKQNVWFYKKDANGKKYKHYLDDKEAAIAYCGCSGVTVHNPGSGNTKIDISDFQTWAESGFQDGSLDVTNPAPGIKRRRELEELWAPGGAVEQYWHCISIGWDNCH
ncbi:hypothetical protein Plo01_62500 [Planobispora longispora]|uniref:WW domain-containing protein n=3 Tax=Planobispora longispora TaxID=28887 RepID=A0A8J3RTD8_9ACTN|nr:hypothetical protein Plo01_62500 [Planobispora longispora]